MACSWRLALVFFLSAGLVTADDRASFEPWIAVGGALAGSGTVTTSYRPRLDGVPQQGRAGQELTLDPKPGLAGELGVAVFPTPHVGLQATGSIARAPLGGTNTPYATHMDYVARQPPDFVPRTFAFDETVAWPDTEGTLTTRTLGVAIAVRLGTGRVTGGGFLGVAHRRTSGRARDIGYTTFNLGGHSVLFSNEAHLEAALEPTATTGVHVGAHVEIAAGRRAAVLVGLRYFGGGDADVPLRLTRIVNADMLLRTEELSDIRTVLQPAPARLSARALDVVVGLKLRR
jgi:hypothetical protein